MLVKYSCGCIGTPVGPDKHSLIFKPCDTETPANEVSIFVRSITKSFEPLDRDEEQKILQNLYQMRRDASQYNAFREIIRAANKKSLP